MCVYASVCICVTCTYLRVDTILLTGMKHKTVRACEDIHTQIKTGLCSLIKLEDVENVVEEATEKAADAIILFCQVSRVNGEIPSSSPILTYLSHPQGLGLVPTVQRKVSRSGDDPKLNMARYPPYT